MADLIAERFETDGIRYVTFTGSTNKLNRELAVLKFTSKDTGDNTSPTVFIATDAAAEGLNLGKECSTVVNFDLSFRPSVMIQRGNRIHRVDGDISRRYRVINLTIAKTLEEGILASIGIKADLADAILGEQGTRVSTTGRSPRKILLDAITAAE
jgi:SNF2 family DNA or RNA helicase